MKSRHLPPKPSTAARTTLSLAALLALAPAAHAQQPVAPPAEAASAPASAADTQSVVITATRRREPAREVPMQVDLLSTQKLEQEGARNLVDVLGSLAGAEVKTSGGDGLGAVSIRGVSTGDQTIATVGTYIDDVAFGSSSAFALGTTTALDMGLLDLNHIEVLRGPQGTLYGAGAMGGLLKYVTNEPETDEFSARFSLEGRHTRSGSWGNTVNGVVNVPISRDVAAVRVAAFRDHDGGWVDVVGPAAARDANHGDTTGGRVSLLVEPGNHLHVRMSALTQDIRRAGTDYVDVDPATGRPVEGDLRKRLVVAQPYSMKIDLASLDLEDDFGWARLNAITAFQHTRLTQRIDDSFALVPALAAAGLELAATPFDQRAEVRKLTQELRLTSRAGGEVEWLAGLWYDHERASNSEVISSSLADGSTGPELANGQIPSTYQEIAAYGDVTWNATSRLALTAGLRVAQNRQRYTQASDGLLFGGATSLSATSQETSKTWLGTARYALTPTSNAYVRVASGYRPGGPNAVARDPDTGQPLAPPTFAHDSLWSYELGYKADLLDKTLSLETALYDIEWKDLQQFYAVNQISVITNAGKARVQGLEFSGTWRPTARWNVTGSLSTIDARLSDGAPGLAQAGARLPNSPRLAATLGAAATFDVFGQAAHAGFSEHFEGERSAGFDGSDTLPNYRLPSYFQTNLDAGIDFARWQLAFYLRNAFDRRAQVGASTSNLAQGGPVEVNFAQPRTLGMRLSASF